MTTDEKLTKLRELMRERGVSAYYIPTADFHLSEYVGEHFKARKYMTGFSGSAGVLIVTEKEARLWVDGRYFIQSAAQIAGSSIIQMRIGEEGVPTIAEYLSTLPEGAELGFDGRCVSAEWAVKTERMLSTAGVTLSGDMDLVGDIWADRPALPTGKIWALEDKFAGMSAKDKLEWLRAILHEKDADAHVLASLDDIAWLLNIRGSDVENNPVTLSFFICERDTATLFIDPKKVDDNAKAYLDSLGISVLPYEEVYSYAKRFDEGDAVMLSTKAVNYKLYDYIADKAIIIDVDNPEKLKKSIKTPVEVENLRRAHVKDGLALTRFIKWAKENVGKVEMTELSAAEKLDGIRLETEGCLDLSFGTICAYGAHAALPHYSATASGENSAIEPRGMLLVDSGGQYYEGTTDVTRTFAVGELTEEEKRHFALVLRSMLALANVRFLHGCRGNNLDILARAPLWEEDIDYKHGTGHGVGYLLNVHEGPNHFMWKTGTDRGEPCILEEGMVTSDEPGIYIEGSHGIRTENEIVCRMGNKNEYGQFMFFETLTLAPIDLDCIDPALLSENEKRQLNEYHANVFDKLAPLMDKDEREWLRRYTRSI